MEPATRRTYAGALNNRIDRNEAVGSRFRVEGMRDHVLSSDCYVEEETVIERHKGGLGRVYEDVNGDPRLPDYESWVNTVLFAYPAYPGGMPGLREHCRAVEPRWVEDTVYEIYTERWALNKTFDNVQWHTERSANQHQCEIFDTCELQPWLAHKECVDDIRRDGMVTVLPSEAIWHDENTHRDIAEPSMPDVPYKPIWKGRWAIGNRATVAGAVANHHVFGPAFDETDGTDRGTINLISEVVIANTGRLVWDPDYKQYTGDIPLCAANSFGAGFYANRYTMTAQANDEYLRVALNPSILVVRLRTTKPQADGFCYRDSTANELQNLGIGHDDDPMDEREWLPVYAIDANGDYVLTTFVVAVPMFRVALGASRIDLNVPDWNTYWEGTWTQNRVMPGLLAAQPETGNAVPGTLGHGDIYDSNITRYFNHQAHHGTFGQRCRLESVARIYHDTVGIESIMAYILAAGPLPADMADWSIPQDNGGNDIPHAVQIGVGNNAVTVSGWCIEFDDSTFGNYLANQWRQQLALALIARRNVPVWRLADQDQYMQFMARTDANPGNVLNALAVGNWAAAALRTDQLFDFARLVDNTASLEDRRLGGNKFYFLNDATRGMQLRLLPSTDSTTSSIHTSMMRMWVAVAIAWCFGAHRIIFTRTRLLTLSLVATQTVLLFHDQSTGLLTCVPLTEPGISFGVCPPFSPTRHTLNNRRFRMLSL